MKYPRQNAFPTDISDHNFSDLRTLKIASGLANLQTVGEILMTKGTKVTAMTSKELKR